jgi:membrane protein DedA with SNARE-associated domain
VFFGRFILGLRVWASWLAGATRMEWRSFVIWNALGGIVWATSIGLIAYFLGNSAGNAIQAFGLYGLAAVAVAIVSAFVMHRRSRRRREAVARAGGAGAGAHAGDSESHDA